MDVLLFPLSFSHVNQRARQERVGAPPGPATQHDTNLAWHSALTQLGDAGDTIQTRTSLLVARDSAHALGWDQLSVQYAVPWPLHLVITPQVTGG